MVVLHDRLHDALAFHDVSEGGGPDCFLESRLGGESVFPFSCTQDERESVVGRKVAVWALSEETRDVPELNHVRGLLFLF